MITMEEKTLERKHMARAVLSSIEEFTNMISREKFQLETQKEVQSIHRELMSMRRFLEDGDGGRADKEEAARQGQYLELLGTIHEAEEATVAYVLWTARHRRRKTLFKRYASCKDSGTRKNFCNYFSWLSKSIQELKRNFKESPSQFSVRKSFKLSDWIRSSIDFDEAEEGGAKDANLNHAVLVRSIEVSPEEFDKAKDEYLSTVVGLGQDMKSLKEWLFSNNIRSIISVLGIQGIGKTRLAWEIYKSNFVVRYFYGKAWVCASALDNDLEDICEDIKKQINEFHSNKKYLIVIDDARDPQVCSELRDEIFQMGADIRILLTTRDVGVAGSANYTQRLKVLSKAESWELFMKKLFITPWQLGNIASGGKNTTDDQYASHPIPLPLPPELEALGKKMVEKCGGIPYLIIELANLLSTMNANIVEWSCVLHGTDTHLSQEQHPWFDLSSSVDNILPFHVKQFLHLFPTATTIPKRRLTLSWAAEGGLLHQRSDSGISAEEEESTAALPWMQDLQDLNLIQAVKVSSIGIVKSYRIPRDLPLLQILEAGGTPGPSDGDDGKVPIHRISDQYDKEDPHFHRIHSSINSPDKLEHYRTLRSFWCFNYPGGYKPGQELGSFLKKCINNYQPWYLRVLDLEGVYKPSLPKAIGDLINLQYLGLRWTYLDTLPSSVEKLQNLQTLDTKHTDIGDYPTIQKMEKLQHLYLNERHRSELITQLSSLVNLQTLSGVIVDDLSHVKDGLHKLKELRKLRLTCRGLNHNQKVEMAKWIGELGNLQTLKLTSKDQNPMTLRLLLLNLRNKQLTRIYLRGPMSKLGFHYEYFELNLTALTFSRTELIADPMPILEGLSKLKLVCLFSKSYNGPSMHCKSGMFKELQILKIWKLEELQEWTVEDGAMAKLKELEIRSCKKLKFLPNLPKALHELKLTDMSKDFTSRVTGEDCEKVADVSSVIIEDALPSFSTSVELYTGRHCVFDQGQLEKLLNSERFKVMNLTKLTLSETKLKQDPMPVLEKLPELTDLILSSKSFTGKHMVCSQGGFKKLQNLTILELEELEKLNVEERAMPKLVELEIRSCKNLKELHEAVKKLKFTKMPKDLTEKFKADKRVTIEV